MLAQCDIRLRRMIYFVKYDRSAASLEAADLEKNRFAMQSGSFHGASDLTRTGDLLITSEMHYRLCYTSRPVDYIREPEKSQWVFSSSFRMKALTCPGARPKTWENSAFRSFWASLRKFSSD